MRSNYPEHDGGPHLNATTKNGSTKWCCVDGAWTLDDNFADTLTLQVAYKAYTTWRSLASAAGSSDAFPAYLVASNLGKFTMDQIFLLAYSASFCDNESPEYRTDWLASHKRARKNFTFGVVWRIWMTFNWRSDAKPAIKCTGTRRNGANCHRCIL